MGTTRLAVLDDHELFRSGLCALLSTYPEFEVVGEASDARAGYTMVDSMRPDLCVVDLRLPGTDGISATRELTRRHPDMRVVILSAHAEPDMVADALQAGARGYILKESPFEECLEGLRAISRGETWLARSISTEEVDHLRKRRTRNGDSGPRGRLDILSNREREVFHLLVGGASNAKIARELCISVKTVETHREHILRKLSCHSIVELIRFAARQNLLD
jgi:DNA-binding NarL/FixJ family response regulator